MSEPTIDDRQQVIADLQAARSELVARGRCRGVPMSPNGRVCILGALAVATTDGYESLDVVEQHQRCYYPRAMAARAAIEPHVQDEELVFTWNDHPDTTDQDVLNLFDKALAELGGLA